MHKSFLQKILTRRLGKTTKISPLQIVLLIVAVSLGYKMVIYFVESMSQTAGGGADSVKMEKILDRPLVAA